MGLKPARASLVSVVNLGTLGGAVSQAKAVNRSGQVVGTGQDASGRTRAFLWRENQGMVDVRPMTGMNASANDISEQGEIVGGGDTGFGEFHAYFLSDGTSFDLGTLGGPESEALAVNRQGQVAGHSRVAGHPAKRAFFIPEPAHMIDLGSPGGGMSIAHDVNDRGDVVGFAQSPSGASHAFLWTGGGQGMLDLGSFRGNPTIALAINNRREVVGGSGRAFRWTADEGMTDLGTLGGGASSCANDINDQGLIVGVSQTGATGARGTPVTHAFLLAPDGTMLDLGTLGGEHSSAAAVSEEDGGLVRVAGHSHDAGGRIRATLWIVRLA